MARSERVNGGSNYDSLNSELGKLPEERVNSGSNYDSHNVELGKVLVSLTRELVNGGSK